MKKFVKGLVLDVKFGRAGEGHRLDVSEASKGKPKHAPKPQTESSKPPARPSEAAMVAGAVAVERIEKQQQEAKRPKAAVSSSSHQQTSKTSSKVSPQARHEDPEPSLSRPPTSTTTSRAAGQAALARLERQQSKEDEKKKKRMLAKQLESQEKPTSQKSTPGSSPNVQPKWAESSTFADQFVYLVCPNCQRVQVYSSMTQHLEACLQEVYLKDPVYGSALLIHSLCKSPEKKATCIDTLCKYLDNIIEHPSGDKYRRIRISNKAFQEKVGSVKGALLFVEAVGFEQTLLPHGEGEEQFYLLRPTDGDQETDVSLTLSTYRDLLREIEPVQPTLHRGLKVFKVSSRPPQNVNLCPDFYKVSSEEIKREQVARTEAVERDQLLLTRAMRERLETKTILRYYRFSLIRVRTPDNYVIQGTFRLTEKLNAVRMFVLSSLASEAFPFNLVSTGQDLSDDSCTLAELGLVPTAVLKLAWVSQDMTPERPFLKADLVKHAEEIMS